MTDRPAKPSEMPWLTPYLTVRDAERSLDFYQRAFGFEPGMEPMRDSEGKIVHAEMRYRGAVIMMAPENAWGGTCKSPSTSGSETPIGLYLYCDNVDGFYSRAVEQGAESIDEPTEMFWGDRMCTLRDPDGYVWSFATNVGDFDPSRIPAM